jgi:hypothetical protein
VTTAAVQRPGQVRLVEVLHTLADAAGETGPDRSVRQLAAWLYRRVYRSGGAWVAADGPEDPSRREWMLGRFTAAPGLFAWRDRGSFLVSNRLVPPPALVRFYWNSAGPSPLELVPRVAAEVDALGIPFTVKCVPEPSWRADRVVLYVPRAAYHDVRVALVSVTADAALRPAVPLCSHELVPGWATAEDPAGELSFGEDRCLLMAETLWTAARRGARTRDAVGAVAEEVFGARGVSVDAPHLARFATSDYTLAPRRSGRGAETDPHPKAVRVRPVQGNDRPDPLGTAFTLAHALADQALWSGDRCTWLTSTATGERPTAASVTRSVGPELYGGVSGIALALARVAAVTGDSELARVALGAGRQALSRADDVPPRHRPGFFAGWSGIASTVAEVGRVLADDCLLDAGTRLFGRLASVVPPDAPGRDLVSGAAGAVLGAAVLPELRSEPAVAGCVRSR